MPLFYAVLVRLSPGYSPLIGRLHTRYSPVRRSPPKYCYFYAAPRLACVKPVASVHPEPGSNSSLYNLFVLISLAQNSLFFISLQLTVLILILYVQENHRWSSHSCTTFCWYVNLSKNSCLYFQSESGYKDNNFISYLPNVFGSFCHFVICCAVLSWMRGQK